MGDIPGNSNGFGRRQRRNLDFSVRSAVSADAAAMAALCMQAGVVVSAQEIVERMNLLAGLGGCSVLVASGLDGRLLGWLHVAPYYSLTTPHQAEIRALIVDRQARGARVGSALLGAAERWAREYRLGLIRVHADALGENADRFYCGRGFTMHPEPQALLKALS